MQGKITKGIAGFYYVHVPDKGIYECKAKGIFRLEKMKPLVGDDVVIEVLDEIEKKGNIEVIMPRKNQLIRPAVANVDQALVIFSFASPEPNYNLLDRFLIMMQQEKIETLICFNKEDFATQADKEELTYAYEKCGNKVLFCNALEQNGMEELKTQLLGKTTTVAGPSGVGKSTIVNCLQTGVDMETGAVSEKIKRGKHTTRHSELIAIDKNSYIVDTPGFSSLAMFDLQKEELGYYYPEFEQYEKFCKFQGCSHLKEPVCGIKEAVEHGDISKIRYNNYVLLYQELADIKKY